MRALVGQNKRFLVRKEKTDRTKRSRRSDGEVSLDNADAVIDVPCPRLGKGGAFDLVLNVCLSPWVQRGPHHDDWSHGMKNSSAVFNKLLIKAAFFNLAVT
jgi:hypothetical protein